MRRRSALSFLSLAAVTAALILSGRAWAQQEGVAADKATPAEAAPPAPGAGAEAPFHFFGFLSDPNYDTMERVSLWVVLLVAVAGLGYAGMLVGQVIGADQGTE